MRMPVVTVCLGLIALLGHGSLAASADIAALETFKYAFKIAGGKATLAEMFKNISPSTQASRDAAGILARRFSIDEFANINADLIRSRIPEAEAKQCLTFIRSLPGAALLAALGNAGDQDSTRAGLRNIPAKYGQPINTFLKSSCYQKAAGLWVSQEMSRATASYGARLVCEDHRNKDPAKFAEAVESGACSPDVTP